MTVAVVTGGGSGIGAASARALAALGAQVVVADLNLDAAKIKALGFGDMVQPLKTSCEDHEGVRKGRIHTWDGKDWSYTSDWYEADMKILGPMIKTSAAAYAAEKKITQRDCSKEK